METAIISIIGTLLGTWLGYKLCAKFQERNTRRLILREIAFEYRRLANSRHSGSLDGLLRAGIRQCRTDEEVREVLELIDDLAPEIETGVEWRPKNGRIIPLLQKLKEQGIDGADMTKVLQVKKEIEGV